MTGIGEDLRDDAADGTELSISPGWAADLDRSARGMVGATTGVGVSLTRAAVASGGGADASSGAPVLVGPEPSCGEETGFSVGCRSVSG